MSRFLPDIVVTCIREAASSGKKLSWTLKEDNRGVLVHLVWKSSQNAFLTAETVGSKKKPRRISPSRQKRSRQRLLKYLSSKQEPTSNGSNTVISPSAESVDVDSQPMPPSKDESRGASREALTTPADAVGVVDAHVIPGNLSPPQPVITSQLSDSDSSGTLLKSSHSHDSQAFLASLSFVTTLFLIFMYFTASVVEDFARLKYRFRFFIIFVRSLVSQGRFFLSGILPLGIHFSIVSRNASWNFVHAT